MSETDSLTPRPTAASAAARKREDTAVREPRHGGDLLALERQDEQSRGSRDLGLGGREVTAEGGLAVGARRHEPQWRTAAYGAVVQEGADRGAALVLVRLRRHRQPGVVGQQGYDAVDVAGLERVREAADDVALELGVRERRPFAPCRRQAGLERGARAAQQAVDRGRARLEDLRDLLGAEAEHVAQHEHGTLLGREVLKARDERERDCLLGLVACVGAGGVGRNVIQQDVGVGLEPDRLAPAGRLGRLGHPQQLFRAAPARTKRIERAVGGDAVKPGPNRRAPLEPLKTAPRGEQGLLEQVLGVLRRSDDPIHVYLELAPVGVGQLAERVFVAGARPGDGLFGHARILSPTLSFAAITRNDVGAARNSPLTFRRGRRLNKRSMQPFTERSTDMGKIVVSENVSLDGVVEDPTGEEGFRHGGWFGQIKDHPERQPARAR